MVVVIAVLVSIVILIVFGSASAAVLAAAAGFVVTVLRIWLPGSSGGDRPRSFIARLSVVRNRDRAGITVNHQNRYPQEQPQDRWGDAQ